LSKEGSIKKLIPRVLCLSVGLFMFCRARESGQPQPSSPAVANSSSANPADPQQAADKGIGPVKELAMGPVDQNLAARGKKLFGERCGVCHSLVRDLTGPALGNVLKRRTPEFVINMILNTAEMTSKNEAMKKAVALYGMAMPPPGLTADEARAVLEYFRTTGK
jgi:mono/diheme cytochrome c family protein